MTLQEVFNQLRQGELRHLSIGGQGEGVVNANNHRILLDNINLGLAALYERFKLKEGRFKLVLIPDVTLYPISTKFSLDNPRSLEPIKYIEALDFPYEGDLAKIESIRTAAGDELDLNKGGKYSCQTPNTKTLRVPLDIVNQVPDLPEMFKTTYLEVIYRAHHHKLVLEEGDVLEPEEVSLDLPYNFLEALLYFVASRVHHPSGMNENMSMGLSYSAKYEQACQMLTNNGAAIDAGGANYRLERNGWV